MGWQLEMQTLLKQEGLVAAGGLADDEVCSTAAQETADGGALVVDRLDGAAVGDGDRLLGYIEAQAAVREMVQEGHADAILSGLWIVCGRDDQRPNQLSKRWRRTAGTQMTPGENPIPGRLPAAGTAGCAKSPQFLRQTNPISTNNSGIAQRDPESRDGNSVIGRLSTQIRRKRHIFRVGQGQ